MDWTPEQAAALTAVSRWLKDPSGPQVFRLFGFAGTGKTTLAKELAKDVKRVAFAAYTGKAALVMRRAGCPGAVTLHRLIYRPDGEEEIGRRFVPQFIVCPESAAHFVDLIVIDECSMVDTELAEDLLSFRKKVLVLGDPGQLPPISNDAGYFTNAEPDFMLTEIHRQALDSPVLRLATLAREGKRLELGSYGSSSVVRDGDDVDLGASDQLLVGMNRTRRALNRELRKRRSRSGELPVTNDELICLRNNHRLGILNGEQFTVEENATNSARNVVKLKVTSRDLEEDQEPEELECTAFEHPFRGMDVPQLPWRVRARHNEFDYSYAITVHKSQGSQWSNVTVYDEWSGREHEKWLYTALTRAQTRVTVVIP